MNSDHGVRVSALILLVVILVTVRVTQLDADGPVTLQNVVDPGPNQPDEQISPDFSPQNAVHFLDSTALQWQKQRKCFTCHTNFAYLYARPYVKDDSPAHREVRSFAEELVNQRWSTKGPRWDAEIVAAAAALAFNDAKTTSTLSDPTRAALDRMWTVQRDDGGWDWLKCDWPPMESDDHYGATLAAIAVGIAPSDYRDTPAARKGMQALRGYFAKNPPQNLHHQAMLLWASKYHRDLITPDQKQKTIDELWHLQKDDGGWASASMGDWKRHDGGEQDKDSSDGYGTGLAIFVLRQAGIAADDLRIQRGTDWLKSNQRKSGRWFTRSLYRDNKHFLTHAGTAFAIMALAECDALDTVAASRQPDKRLRPIPDGLVVLCLDDGNKSDITNVTPILKEFGFRATFFITEGLGAATDKKHFLTWNEVKQLHEAGFEVANHTKSHPNVASLSKEEFRQELRFIQDRCKEHGIPEPTTFCYPGWSHGPVAVATLDEEGFRFARRGVSPEYPDGGRGARGPAYDPTQDHPLLIPTTGYAGPDWNMEDLVWAVDQAKDGKIAVVTFHGVPGPLHPWVHADVQQFREYMSYLKKRKCTVIALDDLKHYVDPTKRPTDPYEPIRKRKATLAGR